MSGTPVTEFDSLAPVPDVSVLELAVVICSVRQPGSDRANIAAEIGRWFKASLDESDLVAPVRRLAHRQWLTSDGPSLHAAEEAQAKAEFAARGIVQLLFRDRYFFDVGKLLDVALVREDRSSED